MGSLLAPINVPAGIWWIDARAYMYIDQLELSPEGKDPDDEAKLVGPLRVDLSYMGLLSMLFQRDDFGVEAYPYDWRKPLSASTMGLRELVEKMYKGNGGRPVHLVAHSMKRLRGVKPCFRFKVNTGARHTLQRKARSRRVDVGNAYPAKSQLEGAVRDGSHN